MLLKYNNIGPKIILQILQKVPRERLFRHKQHNKQHFCSFISFSVFILHHNKLYAVIILTPSHPINDSWL